MSTITTRLSCICRIYLIKLYTSCEANFIKGLEIFEKIIQEQIKIKTEKKIEALKNDIGNPDTIAGI